VRYLVSMSVNTTKSATQNRHSGGCAGGYPGAAGCLASLTVYKEYASVFEGSLVDVNNARLAGKVYAADKAEAGGGVLIFIIFPIPYAYPSAPGTIACRELGRGLAQLIEELDQNSKPIGPR
jgi:hypothetical protein